MIGNPAGEQVLVDFAGGQRENDRSRRFQWRVEIELVEIEKHDHGRECGSFVAVNEWMITSNAKTVGRCERGEIGFPVREFVLGPAQGRFKKPKIANAVGPPEESQLLGMEIQDDSEFQPSRLGHLASAL